MRVGMRIGMCVCSIHFPLSTSVLRYAEIPALTGIDEGHIVQFFRKDGKVDFDEKDNAYDALVPIFFR
jgi:hypothetical protein